MFALKLLLSHILTPKSSTRLKQVKACSSSYLFKYLPVVWQEVLPLDHINDLNVELIQLWTNWGFLIWCIVSGNVCFIRLFMAVALEKTGA